MGNRTHVGKSDAGRGLGDPVAALGAVRLSEAVEGNYRLFLLPGKSVQEVLGPTVGVPREWPPCGVQAGHEAGFG